MGDGLHRHCLATGRMVRILSVVDAYIRKCLALEADILLYFSRVTRVLDQLIEDRGRPENVSSDSELEFTSRRNLGRATGRNIELVHIQPSRPIHRSCLDRSH